ncbi:phage major capsid protein [Comamonas sp. GB3 AK4-5]|uniref:phage major capsid protein n=1 Tax=Comamonas sp. GB3 AK4-5 TaxID=3231487 RepID=UPI00351F1C84
MQTSHMYGAVVLKSADEDAREITGIASTIGTDRDGDIVDPAGAEFRLPLPLLWMHDREQPVGQVIAATVTATGIEIRAKLAKPTADMPSQMAARLEEAWQSIKAGLVRGLSVGYQYRMEDCTQLGTGGLLVRAWDWQELSVVPIPANQDASITSIKSAGGLPAGLPRDGVPSPGNPPPPVSGTSEAPAAGGFFYAQTQGKSMNIQEQIQKLETKRTTLSSERTELQTKAAGEGRTKSAEEQARFGAITVEMTAIDQEIADLRVMETELAAGAKPVHGTSEKAAAASRSTTTAAATRTPHITVQHNHAEKGLALAQWVRLQFQAKGNTVYAAQLAESQSGDLDPRVLAMAKAAVPGASTMNPEWAGNLVLQNNFFFDFVDFLRPAMLLGQFGLNGIPSLHPALFNTPSLIQTSGGAGYWVGEGKAVPLTNYGYNTGTLQPLMVGNIAVLSKKLMERASVKADTMLRDQLVASLSERLDMDFINPDKAEVAGISPASITHGVTPIASSGVDVEAVRKDVQAVLAKFLAAKNPPKSGVWIMGSMTALALSMMRNPLGGREFPEVSMAGGIFEGMPVLVSDYVPEGVVALVNASDVYFADEGGFTIDQSDQASLEMANDPGHDSTTPKSAELVSMWQTRSVAFLAQRELNWAKRRDSAVQLLTGVKWGQTGG